MIEQNPLEQLLDRLKKGQPYSLDGLARSLDVERDLLEHMLRQLEQAGYVRSLELSCQRACAHCSYEGLCAITQGKRIWTVTERGRRVGQHS